MDTRKKARHTSECVVTLKKPPTVIKSKLILLLMVTELGQIKDCNTATAGVTKSLKI
jgi:hypothetical protein